MWWLNFFICMYVALTLYPSLHMKHWYFVNIWSLAVTTHTQTHHQMIYVTLTPGFDLDNDIKTYITILQANDIYCVNRPWKLDLLLLALATPITGFCCNTFPSIPRSIKLKHQ